MSWTALRQYDGGPAMRPDPANATLAELRLNFMAGHGIRVVLEPGDATRYDLLLWPSAHGPVMVVRHVSWDPVGTVVLDRNRAVRPEELAAIKKNNTWTAIVLAWWLTGFFQFITEER